MRKTWCHVVATPGTESSLAGWHGVLFPAGVGSAWPNEYLNMMMMITI